MSHEYVYFCVTGGCEVHLWFVAHEFVKHIFVRVTYYVEYIFLFVSQKYVEHIVLFVSQK